MGTEWFIQKDNKWHGPFTSAKLKELANRGKLRGTDFVRKNRDGKPLPADNVEGLFENGRSQQVDNDWFYAITGRQEGPVCFSDLQVLARKGKLKRSDLVWHDGLTTWQSADSVDGLFSSRQDPRDKVVEPPPLPAMSKDGNTDDGNTENDGDSPDMHTDPHRVDDITLSVMREYEKFKEMTCLECGYHGVMGIESEGVPPKGKLLLCLYVSVLVLAVLIGRFNREMGIPAVLGSRSLWFWFFVIVGPLGFFGLRNDLSKTFLKCPSCNRVIEEVG